MRVQCSCGVYNKQATEAIKRVTYCYVLNLENLPAVITHEFWPLDQFWESCLPDREIIYLLVIDIVGTFLVLQQN